MTISGPLPYVDTHTITVALGPDQVWTAVRQYADQVGFSGRNPVQRLLRTEPVRGFAVTDEVPGEQVTVAGRHRFSCYELTFTVEPRTSDRTTLLHATTRAAFPGVLGRIYRTLVIGSGLHAVATRQMLGLIVRRSVSDGD